MKSLFQSLRCFALGLSLPCGALMRLYMCSHILVVNLNGMLDARSLSHEYTSSAGLVGWTVLCVMTLVAIVGLVDGLVNDVLPQPFVLRCALDLRHLVYMALPLCYALQMWFAADIRAYWLIPYFSLQIAFLVISAFLDVRERYQKQHIKKGACHV